MKNSGFTIIEVVTVMAILGVLLGIAALSVRDWLVRCQVEGQTKELYVDLMNARVSAMQRNRAIFVTLTANPVNQYEIYEDTHPSPEGDEHLQATQDTLVMRKTTRFPLHPSLGLGHTTFYFGKNGLASLNGTIRFDSSVDPYSDCVKLFSTRILVGKMNGTNCIAQ
jgi:prepilin-type N-terminal cleavage/methylation domain-containing protein